MAKMKTVQRYGNQMIVQLDDGSKIFAYPTVNAGVWNMGPLGIGGVVTSGWQTPLDMTITQVSDNYGMRVDPVTGVYTLHAGIDLTRSGILGADIWAASDGIIQENSYSSGSGYYVGIAHPDGTETLYFHMNEQSTVVVGAPVSKGDVIGHVGETGWATGPHLHFQCQTSPPWNDSNSVDPRIYMADPSRMGSDPFPPYDGEG